jgi:hypothetical protein
MIWLASHQQLASKVMGHSASALPSDVRRWLRPADSSEIISGLCPWSGLSTFGLLVKGRTKGIAQNLRGTLRRGIATAAHQTAKPHQR